MSTQSPFDDLDSLTLVNETADQTGDPIFSSDEWDNFSNKLRRRLAANANSDEVGGKSTSLETREFFVRQKSLSEFEE